MKLFSTYVGSNDPQASLDPMAAFEADDDNDGLATDALKAMSENCGGDQVDLSQLKLFTFAFFLSHFAQFGKILLNCSFV